MILKHAGAIDAMGSTIPGLSLVPIGLVCPSTASGSDIVGLTTGKIKISYSAHNDHYTQEVAQQRVEVIATLVKHQT